MQTVATRRELTNAVLELLQIGTAKPVGDHTSVAGTTLQPAGFPNAVLYAIPGGGPSGGSALKAPERDGRFVYQVTSYGLTREQAEWMADMVRLTMLARDTDGSFQVALTPPTGMVIQDRMLADVSGGVTVEGDAPHRIYCVAERFLISTTPA